MLAWNKLAVMLSGGRPSSGTQEQAPSGVFCLFWARKRPMLSPDRIKKIDPNLADLSEQDLEKVTKALYDMAQLAFEVWWAEKNGSNNPTGVLTNPAEEPTL